jgi:hypothetical protein
MLEKSGVSLKEKILLKRLEGKAAKGRHWGIVYTEAQLQALEVAKRDQESRPDETKTDIRGIF